MMSNKIYFFQENRTYSLWVTATDESSIPQRTEVLATVTDNTGARPNLPRPPPFALPSYPSIPIPPKFTRPTPTTKAEKPLVIEDATVPAKTTVTSYKNKTKDLPNEYKVLDEHDETKNKIKEEPSGGNSDIPLTVIPVVAIGGLVIIVGAVIIFVWKKNHVASSKTKKEDMVSRA